MATPTKDDPDFAYGYQAPRRVPFIPTPFDVSDVVTALKWPRGIRRRQFRLIYWRSFGLSFSQIRLP